MLEELTQEQQDFAEALENTEAPTTLDDLIPTEDESLEAAFSEETREAYAGHIDFNLKLMVAMHQENPHLFEFGKNVVPNIQQVYQKIKLFQPFSMANGYANAPLIVAYLQFVGELYVKKNNKLKSLMDDLLNNMEVTMQALILYSSIDYSANYLPPVLQEGMDELDFDEEVLVEENDEESIE